MTEVIFILEKDQKKFQIPQFYEYEKFKLIQNDIVKGSKNYNYEFSAEFYLLEPHDNDLYVQNWSWAFGGENMKKITCRPCKEQNNWEIVDQNGNVSAHHYQTKASCVRAGEKMAHECGCELCVCDVNPEVLDEE